MKATAARRLRWVSLAFALAVPWQAAASSSFSVGNFTRQSAPTTHLRTVSHGLGQVPVALLVWTDNGAGAPPSQADEQLSIGMTDGLLTRSMSGGSESNASPSETTRATSTQLVSFVAGDGGIVTAADFQSWNDAGFSIKWKTDGNPNAHLHFLAIGPPVSARVVQWTMPADAGPVFVEAGFRPSAVLSAYVVSPVISRSPMRATDK